MRPGNPELLMRISAARLIAIESQPYLASALFAMAPRFTSEISHIATDEGWRIYFNSKSVDELSAKKISGVWLHQLAHCLRGHARRFRALGEHPSKAPVFQRASDAVINSDLQDTGIRIPRQYETLKDLRKLGLEIPENPTSEFVFRTLSDLRSNQEDVVSRADCGSCSDGQKRDYEEPLSGLSGDPQSEFVSQSRAESIREYTAVQIRDSERQGRRVSKAYRRWAQQILEPRVDWREELASITRKDIADRVGQRTHSYRRPSRRQAAIAGTGQGIILPAMREKEPPQVAVVVDTSASMDTTRLELAIAETSGILEALGISEQGILFISCDTGAYVSRVRQTSEINLLGGGGTDMRIGIELATKQRPRPELIIVITDGETPWPSELSSGETVVAVLTERHALTQVPSWIRSVHVLDSAE